MSADFAWYESDDTTVNSDASFTPTNGVATAAVERHLGNVGDTDSEDILVTGISRPAGSGDYTDLDALAAGGYIQVRLIGSSGYGIVNQTSAWTRVGRGRYLRVKAIPAGCFRHFEVRADVPLGVGILAKDYKLRLIEDMRAIMLEMGHTEGGAQGVRIGLGDLDFTEILSGGVMTEDGTPDNTVHVSLIKKVVGGVPGVNIAETLTFSNLDSNSAALGVGEEYLARVSVDATGAAVVSKSAKGTAPLPETGIPAVPDGARSLGWVQVQYDAIINTADIHQDDLVYGCGELSVSGTSGTLSPFESITGNSYVVVPSEIPLTFVDDDVNYVFVDPSGSAETNTTGIQPESMSQLWYEVTLASGVATVRDTRQWVYPAPVEVSLSISGVLSGSPAAYGVLPSGASAYLLPVGGVTAAVGDRGGTSGSTVFDVSATDRDNTYVTIYTGATDRPEIAYNASEPIDSDSTPKRLLFKGGTRFKLEVPTVPGTASNSGVVRLRFSAVGAA